jgi:hypothetical protein
VSVPGCTLAAPPVDRTLMLCDLDRCIMQWFHSPNNGLGCPLCKRECTWLVRMNEGKYQLTAVGYEPEQLTTRPFPSRRILTIARKKLDRILDFLPPDFTDAPAPSGGEEGAGGAGGAAQGATPAPAGGGAAAPLSNRALLELELEKVNRAILIEERKLAQIEEERRNYQMQVHEKDRYRPDSRSRSRSRERRSY